jgi:hypothetical protein
MAILQTLLTASLVLALTHLLGLGLLAIVAAVRVGGRRDSVLDDQDALSISRFTIPVSVIVPPADDFDAVSRTIEGALHFNYPELEVIVVVEDSLQSGFDRLSREWQLEAKECFYRQSIETASVRRMYKSGRDARLMVIDKTAAGYSDALNCAINVARFRYVIALAPDIRFDENALLRVMRAALIDPANVVGASGHVEWGASSGAEETTPSPAWRRLTGSFQRLGSLRSLMATRLSWRHARSSLGPPAAVVVWRRDAVLRLHGFSRTAADADLDMMFRLQMTGSGTRGGRFHRSRDIFGCVGPQPVGRVLDVVTRRQRGALQALSTSLAAGWRGLGRRSWLQFVESEIVTPFAQIWLVVGALVGAVAGWYAWTSVGLVLVVLSFGNAALTAAALLLRGAAEGAPDLAELRRLLLLGPVELIVYRPALATARLLAAGSWRQR